MCFIKKFVSTSPCLLEDFGKSEYQRPPDKGNESSDFLMFPFFSQEQCAINQFAGLSALASLNILTIAEKNSEILMKLQEKILKASEKLEEAKEAFEMMEQQQKETEKITPNPFRSKESAIEKLFGQKEYKYRLRLRNRIPSTIYKQRNLALSLELQDAEGSRIMNSNLLTLCIAACQNSGQWVLQDEDGRYFIQGRNQVELFHGEAQFQKIYPRDVSRLHKNGKIAFVFYAKSSLLCFETSSSGLQQVVRAQEIEPLLIHDITVRAKKKQH